MELRGSRPTFLIIGAQKAASTALLNTLRSHPEIWMPEQEDPFLRDPVFDIARLPEFLASYASHPEPIIGLKCPDYLGRAEVPQRIVDHLDRPKIILIVRNPVERAISGYFWQMRWGSLPIVHPDEGFPRLMRGEYLDINPRSAEVLDWGLYHKHIQDYLRLIPFQDLLVIHDKDFRSRREEVLAEVLKFIGAEKPGGGLPVTRSSNEGVYPLPRLRFLQIRNRLILRWTPDRSYSTIFKPRNPLLRAYSNGVAAIDRWILARVYGNAKPSISAEVIEQLRGYYEADATDFQRLIGKRLEGWPYREESLPNSSEDVPELR
ncbi:sulfotransferase domain-containing protein [Microbacterium schleiferi]|uniref:sulfotransferase domain-containing protein n=1 Tax=Microbacterium schleiferi TaxID=69362 RepID=UPI00311D7602